ncbi:hypothetical protein G7046_g4395 [Stylonectria norvegica]|nr:hypothetical protein G7046_g4395 [Stylonectria norvegica]
MAPTLETLSALALTPVGIFAFILGCLGCLISIYWVDRLFFSVPYPPGIPLLREPKGARRFSLRTRLGYYTDCESLFREAYENYAKKGLPVVIPGIGSRKEVIMPSNAMRWVLAQPDKTLDTFSAFADIQQVQWAFGHEKVTLDSWQSLIVKHDLNRVLEGVCSTMNDELAVAFDDEFGTDAENWKEVLLFPAVERVVAQAASRFTVGLPLCRDQEYNRVALKINHCLITNAGTTGGTPSLFRPLVGSLVNIPLSFALARMKKLFVPLWKQRLETLKFDRDDVNHEEPEDQIQMMLRYAQKERPQELYDYDLMMRRLIALNFGTMHQTVMQVANLLLDVLASDAEFNAIATLRDEFDRVLGPDDTEVSWTKAKASQMTRADSVARETLRCHAFANRAIFRKVMVDGFKTNDGYHLPKGTILSFLSRSIQNDAESYDDAAKFDPFRFSRAREDALAKDEKPPSVSLVATSPEFLAFSHGRHSCPGRFLLDFELKMILAYVLRKYDVKFPDEYNGQRPPNYWLTEAVFPPDGNPRRYLAVHHFIVDDQTLPNKEMIIAPRPYHEWHTTTKENPNLITRLHYLWSQAQAPIVCHEQATVIAINSNAQKELCAFFVVGHPHVFWPGRRET